MLCITSQACITEAHDMNIRARLIIICVFIVKSYIKRQYVLEGTLVGVYFHILSGIVLSISCSRDVWILTSHSHWLQQASALSREKKLPRVYIAANSGARIGLAEELKHLYRVAWVDEAEPDKGYKYLYLSSADYMKVKCCYFVTRNLFKLPYL